MILSGRLPDEDGQEEANCEILENGCDINDLAKVVLRLTQDVHVDDGHRVELLCRYDLKKLDAGSTVVQTKTKRALAKTRRQET